MGVTDMEKCVLKLVYPRRYTEILKEPISASEVLRKYPRHSITRPDIFDNPWIVVKPESILTLGKVFFVVPNHKIYSLRKAKEKSHQTFSSTQSRSPKEHVHSQAQNHHSPCKYNAGNTPKHQHKQIMKQRLKKVSQVVAWPEVIARPRNTYGEFKLQSLTELENGQSLIESNTEISPSASNDVKFCCSISNNFDVRIRDDDDEDSTSSNKERTLKSCLRKPDSIRRSINLKVTFVMSNIDEERQSKARASDCRNTNRRLVNW